MNAFTACNIHLAAPTARNFRDFENFASSGLLTVPSMSETRPTGALAGRVVTNRAGCHPLSDASATNHKRVSILLALIALACTSCSQLSTAALRHINAAHPLFARRIARKKCGIRGAMNSGTVYLALAPAPPPLVAQSPCFCPPCRLPACLRPMRADRLRRALNPSAPQICFSQKLAI